MSSEGLAPPLGENVSFFSGPPLVRYGGGGRDGGRMQILESTCCTCGQLEAAVCEVMTRFHREVVGRGPDQVSASLKCCTLVIHLKGVLTTAEKHLVDANGQASEGVEMVRAMRAQIVRHVRPLILEALAATIGHRATSLFHDFAPTSNEEVFVVIFSPDRGTRPRPE